MSLKPKYYEISVSGLTLAAADALSTFLIDQGISGVVLNDQTQPASLVFYLKENELHPAMENLEGYLDSLKDLGEFKGKIDSRKIKTEDWAETWKRYFTLNRVTDRLLIKPTWEPYTAKSDEVVIELDPGQAFGIGTHDSTRLILERLEYVIERLGAGINILDVGCGSGILAIAAIKLGAGRALALDIDPIAVSVARKNAAKNNIAHLIKAETTPLGRISGEFSLVMANITGPVLEEMMPDLKSRVRPGGILLLSGISRQEYPDMAKIFADEIFEVSGFNTTEEWQMLELTRKLR
jgi:ribosomal protein L11 methyltransferase